MLLSRYIRYHMSGGSLVGEDADFTMMIDGGIAAMAGFAMRQAFRFQSKEFIAAFNVGVAAMVVGMHNLVFMAPQAFATAFSPQWVIQVAVDTKPNSILFRGVSFELGEPAEETAHPAILELQSAAGPAEAG